MFYESFDVPPDRCFSVPLAIDNEHFSQRAEEARQHREEIRAKYGIPSNVILLLFVGKLIARKRPQDVLYVLKTVQSRLPHLGAAFVGDGSLKASLESETVRQNIKNVFFLGFRNQAELPSIYAASDIFILPSHDDPKPLVTNEAMACGLPVLASDRTGIWGPDDILRDGENGIVYPCGDIPALERAIEQLASDDVLRARMGKRSKEIIEAFGYDSCVQGILESLAFLHADSGKTRRGLS
jgi:glycosyltransferase involved in cell wall biosynthesis